MQGQTDIPLNETGRLQARDMAEKLRAFKLREIIASDLSRTRETAEIIGQTHDLTPRLDARLRECGFGSLEGKHRSELWDYQDNPKLYHPYDLKKYGGEDSREVLRRQIELLRELEPPTDESILLVGHGRSLRTLLINLGHVREPIDHGEIIVLPFQDIAQALPTVLEQDPPHVFLD